MIKLGLKDYQKSTPTLQLAPLIDIIFITLIFYMTLSVFYQMETELSVSVPISQNSEESVRSPGEIIINVDKSGKVIVNQKQLTDADLRKMLNRISSLYPNQPVIIRADEKTYHESVVRVLDACAEANIWNIAFSTAKEK